MIILTIKSRIITQGRARCKFRALYDACSVAWVQSVGLSDTCGQARVDVDICEFGKKKLRIQKYSDTKLVEEVTIKEKVLKVCLQALWWRVHLAYPASLQALHSNT